MKGIDIIPREHYLEKLRGLRGFPIIKGITGIRRCGKSTLMAEFIGELKASGIPEDRILYINLDDESSGIETWRNLLDYVAGMVGDPKGSYLFLDEIQNIPEWERAVSTLFINEADIYITGSNSQMLSTELSTKLSGRCVEIRMQPLVFREYLQFRKDSGKDAAALLDDYIRRGGFPTAALLEDVLPELVPDMLMGIYNTVYTKDVSERNSIRNNELASNVCRFIMKNIGDRTSIRSVSNYLTSKGTKTRPETVDSYISMLEKALLIGRARRMDLKTKEYLRTSEKFYAADLGLRNVIVPYTEADLDGIMENIVFNELIFRYGRASVCSVGDLEIDFIADSEGVLSYYQVCMNICDESTRERELKPLRSVRDNYPKTIITYDRFPLNDIDGIKVVPLSEWLTEDW